MFETCIYDVKIKKVEVERKTDKSIWISGSRRAIKSTWINYFETFEEAKNHQLEFANKKVKSAKFALDCAESFLEKVKPQEAN